MLVLEHGLEKPGRLHDIPPGFPDIAVFHLDFDVAMAFDTRKMMDIDI
jgi:hypothetical protein